MFMKIKELETNNHKKKKKKKKKMKPKKHSWYDPSKPCNGVPVEHMAKVKPRTGTWDFSQLYEPEDGNNTALSEEEKLNRRNGLIVDGLTGKLTTPADGRDIFLISGTIAHTGKMDEFFDKQFDRYFGLKPEPHPFAEGRYLDSRGYLDQSSSMPRGKIKLFDQSGSMSNKGYKKLTDIINDAPELNPKEIKTLTDRAPGLGKNKRVKNYPPIKIDITDGSDDSPKTPEEKKDEWDKSFDK